MTVLCLGQARAIRETAQAWPPVAVDQDGHLLRVCEMLLDNAVGTAGLVAHIMERAWHALLAGQVEHLQDDGEKLDWLLRDTADSIARLEVLLKRRRAAGLPVPNLLPLAHAVEALDRLNERFRKDWPHLSPQEQTLQERPTVPESIVSDTDTALTLTEMAEAFDKLGTSTTQQDIELSVDPDDYPLF